MGRKAPGGVIAAVEPDSLGSEIGLVPGDQLIAINGHLLRDIIDVQFYSAEEYLEFLVERDGQQQLFVVQRDYDTPLGLDFANPTFDVDIRRCANNCDFCFVKQNARGMRRSLYIKDDDYRYSFLFGNFVTLTNLTAEDWDRLEEQCLSPLYISVHATDIEVRRRFLARKTAPDILDQLRRLNSLGIKVHTQVVLVPGLNDGEHLDRTLADLTALHTWPVRSIGIVPIGLTGHHRGQCRTYTPEESRAVLDQVEPWRRKMHQEMGWVLVHPSDEWYLVAGRPIPHAAENDGGLQVENGVGMVRALLDEWERLKGGVPELNLRPATLACGTLIGPVLAGIVEELNELSGGGVRLVPVVNEFFGAVTTVSGLLTGQDIVAALSGRDLGETVLLPHAMFTGSYGAGSAGPGMTLDDMSIADLQAQLGVPVEMARTMTDALDFLKS